MAKYTASPFGKLSGKLGSAVGSTWKGILYARSLVIPANPNTELQQAQRSLMTVIVLYGKQVLSTIVQKFWDPFVRGVSGFNAFCKANLDAMATAVDWPNMIFGTGPLEGATILNAGYSTGTGNVTIEWDTDCLSNGLATDDIVGIVIDTEHDYIKVSDVPTVRSGAEVVIAVGSGRTATALKGYLFAYRLDGTVVTMVSPTDYVQIVAV